MAADINRALTVVGRCFRKSLLLLMLGAASLPALAQNAVNVASVAPPAGVENPGTRCVADNGAGGFNDATDVCSATDTDPIQHGITLTKVWTNAITGDTVSLTITGATGAVAGSSTAPSTTTNATATAGGGVTVTLTEAFTTGVAANYATTLACVRDLDSAAIAVTGTGLSRTITMPADSAVTCTYTNARIAQQLNLAKSWAAGSVAGHTATVATTGGTNNPTFDSTAPTATTGAAVAVFAGDVVTLPAETFGGGATAAGYTTTVACDGGSTLASGATGRSLTISGSATATICTYINTPVPATLTLQKTVVNTGGGTAIDTAWTLTATGPDTISGTEGAAAVTAAQVAPGNYVLTEGGGPAGYTASDWACTGTTVAGGNQITLALGDSATCTITNTFEPAPALTIDKVAGTPTGATAGSTIAYTFTVTNTGNVTLTNVVVTDAQLDAPATCDATTLAPGAVATCTGTHTITQDEVNAGTSDNSATATGTPPGGQPPVTSPPDTTTTPLVSDPSLTIDKVAGTPTGATAGSTIAYTFTVTNTGNVTLTNVTVTDAQLDAPATCDATTLAPGAVANCTGTHTITQDEVNAGTTNNSATATGTPPVGPPTTSPPDTTTTPITPDPRLTIDKVAGTPTGATAGSTIAYTFTVTNTGNVTLTNVTVTDAQLDAPATCDATTLAPGAVATCTGTHTITQDEVNAGTTNNSATATGTPPVGPPTTSPPDTTQTPLAPAPALTIDKVAGTPTGATAGSTIAYTFTVTNTGNVTLTNVTVTDAQLDAPATCDATTLAPGAVANCTGTHTITQDEVNAGTTNNSATATGTPPGGQPPVTSPPDTTTTPLVSDPSLTIDKVAGTPTGATAGSTIAYTFTVTNTGNVTLTNVTVTDAQLDAPATCDATTLAPQAVATCTGTHTITQDEVNAGTSDNSATATGTPPGGQPPVTSPPDTTTTPLVSDPSLTIDKVAGTPTGATAGSTIAYTFTVTNTGNVTLTNVTVADAQLDAPATCDATTLVPGAVANCTGTHTITQDEVNAGTTNNSATATGTPPGGQPPVTSPPDTTATPLAPAPALTIDKVAGTPTGATAGSTIAYTFTVTNTGNVTLTNVVVTDAQLDAPATCDATTLAPGAVATCTGTHTITQDEVNAGTTNNSATATGTPPVGPPTTSPPDTTTTPITPDPRLTIDKVAGTPTGATAGSTIAYTFTVTNTGNVTLTNVTVADAQLDAPATCDATTLAPGAVATCTGTHTITQDEVNAGTSDNSATATGTPPGGQPPVTSPPDTTTTPLAPAPALTIDKVAGTPTGATAGSTIAYTFTVTNTGNVTLTNVTVTDAQLDAPATCDATTLAPGAVANCTGTHTITQDEVNAGTTNNSATATGTPPVGPPTTSPPDTTQTPLAPAPALTIDKVAGTPTGATAGSTIAYTFTVTNTGNVTLTNVTVTDAQLDAPATCDATTLAPGAVANCTGTHTITQDEVNAGTTNNSATATGTPPGGQPPVTSPPDTTTTPITPDPRLTIDKVAGTPTGATAGSTIAYTFTVTNTGNVTLTNVVVTDAQLDAPATCDATTLAPGAVATCTGTHTITQDEVNAGTSDNSATATGTPPVGPPTTSPPDTTQTPLAPAPALTIDKVAGTPTGATAGSTIAYTFTVTNTGNVTLTNVVVTDAQLDAPATCDATTLAPGAVATCTGTHTITQDEVNAGTTNNSATATGTPPGGQPPVTSPPDTTTTPLVSDPSLTIDKVAGTPTGATAGSTIAYTFTVTNTGNVTLTNVTVADAQLDAPATCDATTLAPQAVATCTGTHTITQDEVNAGTTNNSATATGTPPGGQPPVTSPPDTTTTPLAPAPALTIDKSTTTANYAAVGDTISYSYLVTNTGNVSLTGPVTVADDKTTVSCPAVTTVGNLDGELDPAESVTCTATYTVTLADLNSSSVVNIASATVDGVTSPTDTVTVNATQTPALTIDKSTTTANYAAVGDTISYSYLVTNTGNVSLTGPVTVADDKTTVSCPAVTTVGNLDGELDPAESVTCTATYTVTLADLNSSSVVNIASATVDGVTSPTDTVTVNATQAPALTIDKSTTTANYAAVGDTISYSYLVTNTGNVSLTGPVTVADDKTTVSCPAVTTVGNLDGELDPAESVTCTATYTVTLADLNSGSVVNIASATVDGVTSPTDTVTVNATQAPELTSAKAMTANADEDGSGTVTVGDTLTYTVTVTNTGNVTLTDVVVTDNKITPNTIACASVVPGNTCVLTGTYRVSLADANAGNVVNAAVVTTSTPGICPPGSTAPECNPTVTVPVVQTPALSSVKAMTGNADEDGNGAVSLGDTLTYTVTVTNTGNVTLTDVVVTDNKIAPNTIACASVAPAGTCVLTGTYRVTQADVDAGSVLNAAVVTTSTPGACPSGSTAPECNPTVTVPIQGRPAIAATKTATLTTDLGTAGVGNAGDVITYAVTVTNTGNVTLVNLTTLDTYENGTPTTLNCAPTTLAPGAMATCNSYSHTITEAEANAGGTLDNVVVATGTHATSTQTATVTATSTAVVTVEPVATVLRVSKQANPRDVKVGDLVRYTVTIENTGRADAADVSVIDTPPAGFSYVDNSLQVADTDGAGRLVGTFPVRVDQVDIVAGGRATLVYLLRVGAGVRPGVHVNSVFAEDNGVRSNVATAQVQMVADPLLDESLIIGTVFDDRDQDGWQDPAGLSGIRIQGGFAPGAYVANSTTVDRGNGPAPEADASSPLLHGIDLGAIAARQSDADPIAAHRVVVSQTLSALDFDDGFALTTAEGLTVRMDKAGNSRVERSGDAAKGLTGADPKVERRVAQVEGGYRVDYIVSNAGVEERGIPGVRIASMEGLLIETDQFGRYHLEGVAGGPWERGRNFILKVDPATLPPGSVFTTDNPVVRRVTPGLPVRFDFGVRLPPGEITGAKEQVEMRIGEVFFAPGSAAVTPQYLPAVEKMAEKVREYGSGEVVIVAQGEYETLAMDRALAVRKALEDMLTPEQFKALTVSVRTEAERPESIVVGFAEWPLLGEVLFDTDRSTIKPQYRPLIDKMAAAIEQMRSTRIVITGHTDKRASDDYNVALGMRRAKAVYDAIAAKISPELRRTFRVDLSNDPAAPAGEAKK